MNAVVERIGENPMNWSGTKVLVTGGAGFIGSHLVKRLCMLDACVYVIDNLSTGRQDSVSPLSKGLYVENVTSIGDSKLALAGSFDMILHLAAPSSDVLFRENQVRCTLETLTGFAEVLRFGRKHDIRKIVYASSSSVYGTTALPHSESSTPQPTNLYGATKLATESIAELEQHFKTLGLRIFAGYGPGEEVKDRIASVITIWLRQLLKGQSPVIFGDGSQRRDLVYVDDIVEAFIRGAESEHCGIINVGSGVSHSFIDVLARLNRALGTNIEPIFMPKPSGYSDITQADVSKMRKCLGLAPISLDEGIERLVKYHIGLKEVPR